MNGRGHGPGLLPRIKLSARLVAKKPEKRTGGLTWRDRPVTILSVAVMSTDKTTAGAICQQAVLHRPMASADETKTIANSGRAPALPVTPSYHATASARKWTSLICWTVSVSP
jgi:hypothetical protein